MNKLKEYLRTKGLKNFIIFVVSAGLVGGTFAISRLVKNSNDYVGKRATKIVVDKLNSDEELLKQSEAMDCYDTIYSDEYRIGEALTNIENDMIKANDVIAPQIKDTVTLEEVRNSINNIGAYMHYFMNIGRYVSLTEEEMNYVRNTMVRDYAVIMKYTSIHQDENYSNFLVGTMAKMLDNLYQENNIDNIQINSIIPVNDETIAIEANINGKTMNFTIQGKESYDLFSKVLEKNKSTFVTDLQKLSNELVGKTEINAGNQIVKKFTIEEIAAMIGLGIVLAACVLASQSGMVK